MLIDKLKVFFNNFDKVVDFIGDLMLIYPGDELVLRINDEHKILRIVLVNDEVVSLRRKTLLLVGNHNQHIVLVFTIYV
jgi:hypothetical protein